MPVSERPSVFAIVGRPNVGKSTLYNRLVGGRDAVVDAQPGVTRDRKEGDATWAGHRMRVVDTGGWLPAGSDEIAAHSRRGGPADPHLDAKVSAQSERAIADADLVLLVVDVTTGVTEADAAVAKVLRRSGAPAVLAVNKVDSDTRRSDVWEFVRLGVGEPWALSALHGTGVGDLLDHCVERLEAKRTESAEPDAAVLGGAQPDTASSLDGAQPDDVSVAPQADSAPTPRPQPGRANLGRPEPGTVNLPRPQPGAEATAVAIVGRPNVGKSTLFNRLVGDDRAVVHDLPGTTRDAIDTVVDTDAGQLRFIDTAGLRRRTKVDDGTEYYANLRALRAIERADVVLMVVDAIVGVTHQDQRLAERIDTTGSAVVVLLNKWEVASPEARADCLTSVGRKLGFVGAAPVLKVSALTGKGIHKLLPALRESIEAHQARVPTSAVNDAIAAAQAAQPAPRGARVLYATQGATHPPTFTLFVNRELPASYLRYLERCLAERFDLQRTPLKLRVRRR